MRLQALRTAQVRAVTSVVFRRGHVILPVFALNVTLLALAGYPVARVVAVALCYAMGLGLQTFIGLRSARCPHPHRSSLFGLVGVIFAQGGVIGATGALASPFSPLLLSVGIGSLIIYGRSRESAVTLLLISGVTMVLAQIGRAHV